jgi:hypothetical protein
MSFADSEAASNVGFAAHALNTMTDVTMRNRRKLERELNEVPESIFTPL